MSQQQQLVVFSDMDGTLLDHDTYSWQAAAPALEQLKARDIPLIPVTSKTRAEVVDLRTELNNANPYIVENGAAIYLPNHYFAGFGSATDTGAEQLISTGPTRAEVQTALRSVRDVEHLQFESFAELGAQRIAELTGLSVEDAEKANERAASEPLLWLDSDARLSAFSNELAEHGLKCVRGGRFVHVMGKFDKADAVAMLTRLYTEKFSGQALVTVALGDGPNDLSMLANADIAVVVKGKHDFDMSLSSHNQVVRTQQPGPAGWNNAILQILDDYST